MPVYYNGDNIAPFSQGMMIGFELFDRARSRRVEAEDRKVALAQNAERMQMARDDQKMQRDRFTMEQEDRDIRLEKDRVDELDKRRLDAGARLGELAAVHGGLDKAPRDQVIKLTREGDPSRYASAGDEDVYAGASALAMEGSDYIENEALRQRGITEKSDQVEGLLSLQGIAAGGAAPTQMVDGSARRRGGGPAPRGLRNNNPGNLRASDTPWRGKVGNDGEFEQFETPEAGLRAASRNLVTGAERGANTLRTAIARWAPSNENDTAAYIERVSTQLGVDPDQPLDFSNPAVNAAVLGGIVGVENGEQPFSQEQLMAAASAALGTGDVADPGAGGGSGTVRGSLLGVTATGAPDSGLTPAVNAAAKAVGGAIATGAARAQFRYALDPENPAGNPIRRDPVAHVDQFLAVRDEMLPGERAQMDELTFRGFKANMDSAKQEVEVASEQLRRATTPAEQAKARASLTAVQDRIVAERKQLDALTAASAKDRIATAMPRPAAPGDKPAQALEGAVAAERASPQTSTTAAEQRGLNTQMGRMAENPPARFSQEQIKRISRAVATGVITMDQANNLVRYGQMEAPAGMKVTSLGNGIAIMSDGTSYRVLDMSDEVATARAKQAGVGKGGMTLTEERQRHASGAKYLTDRLVSMRENSEFDAFGSDAPVHTIVGDFYDSINSSRSDLESRFGFRLTGADGNTTLAHLSEGDIARLTGWYKRYREEELDAFFPDGKTLGDYADIAPVGARAAQTAQGDDGWVVESE